MGNKIVTEADRKFTPPIACIARRDPAHWRPWPACELGARCRDTQQEEPRQALQKGRLNPVRSAQAGPVSSH